MVEIYDAFDALFAYPGAGVYNWSIGDMRYDPKQAISPLVTWTPSAPVTVEEAKPKCETGLRACLCTTCVSAVLNMPISQAAAVALARRLMVSREAFVERAAVLERHVETLKTQIEDLTGAVEALTEKPAAPEAPRDGFKAPIAGLFTVKP